jgi:hypothetical protein
MRSTRYPSALLCVTLLVASATTSQLAKAVVVVDQSQTLAFHHFPVESWAQSFTPDYNHIYAIDLNFVHAGAYNIQIKDLSGGYNGPVIGSTGFVGVGTGVQHIVFPSPISLVPGSLYDINIVDTTPSFFGDYVVRGWAGANAYPDGIAHFPGSTANGQSGHDIYFVTYAAIPEPSMVVFGAIGLLALVGFPFVKKHISAPAFLKG